MDKPIMEIAEDMEKIAQLALFYSPISKERTAEFNFNYWYFHTVGHILFYTCLDVPATLKLKLRLKSERGFSAYERMMLNKMIDFYQTQHLSKQLSEKVDMLAIHDIVIQYDPSQDAILITRIAIGNEQDDTSSLAPLSLRPKVATIPLPSPETRRIWEEPIITMPGQAYGPDYFREDVETDEDEGNDREG